MNISAGFVVFRQVGDDPIEYLLLKTSTGEGHWTPPKGHLQHDESPLQAAERETKEEAGLDKNDYESYDQFEEKITYQVKGKPKDVYYYLARLYNPQQQINLSNEHQDLRWSDLQESCSLVKHEVTTNMNIASMFDRICSSNIVIASQQRNEPDLTDEQKHDILHHLYTTSPDKFIFRFGSLLTDDELKEHFDSNADYIRQIATPNRHKIRVNRRYTYMQQLLTNGTYFSDEAMKERSPLLYEQMIGRYNDNETNQLVMRTASGPLADFYMEHLESMNHQERVVKEFEDEEQLRNDEDSESDEDEDENKYSNTERDLYRQEFLAIQKEKFLNGEDSNIDYASIDNNDNLDDLKIREHDEEEKYFDDEDSYVYNNEER